MVARFYVLILKLVNKCTVWSVSIVIWSIEQYAGIVISVVLEYLHFFTIYVWCCNTATQCDGSGFYARFVPQRCIDK